jgi:antitoxin (DNA-binding transcriptional repressor) of toxin-antitoxin stability system
MGAYSVAEAQQQLSRLVEEALMGEVVTITRDGQAVVTLTPSLQPPSAIDAEYLSEMQKRALSRPTRVGDAVTFVREMRDEDR